MSTSLIILGCVLLIVGFRLAFADLKILLTFYSRTEEFIDSFPEIEELLTPQDSPFEENNKVVSQENINKATVVADKIIKNVQRTTVALWWTSAFLIIGGIISLCFGIKLI